MASFDKDLLVNGWTLHTLLSAARATYNNMLHIPDAEISPLLMQTMTILDAAIEEGHQVLGTDRGAADQYVNIIGGLTKVQAQNIQALLQREGLDSVDNSG